MQTQRVVRLEELEEGLRQLSVLSQDEYGQELSEVLADTSRPVDERLKRVGRLVGVAVKQPFSTPVPIDPAQSRTRARRAWRLVEKSFADPTVIRTWQHTVLDKLRQEEWIEDARGFQPNSPKALAEDAYAEQGFFWYLAQSCQRYVCGNPEMKKKIKEALGAVPGSGAIAQLLSPQYLLGAGGTTAATYLVAAVPWLAGANVLVVAGILVIIGTIGMDAFCDWAKNKLDEPYQAQRDQ